MEIWAYAQRSHWTKKQKPVRVQEEHGHVPHLMAEALFPVTPGTALASLWTLSTSSPRPGYIIPPTLLLASGHGLSSAKPSYPPSFPEVAASWYGMCIPGVLRLNQPGAASLRSLPASTYYGMNEMLWIILKLTQCLWGTVKEASVIISECCNFCFTYECWGAGGVCKQGPSTPKKK